MRILLILLGLFASIKSQEGKTDLILPDKYFEKALIISYEINRQNSNLGKYQKQLNHVRDIGYRIAAQTNDSRPFTFQIINDPSVNAFAMPGGFIFITTGMMKLNLSDEEWAHLLGHELAHIVQNHHARAMQKSLNQWPLILASLAASIYASYELSKQNSNLYTNDSANQHRQELNNLLTLSTYGPLITSVLYSLKFTREFENEADLYGRKYAALAGYSAKGAESLFQRLSKTDNPHIDHIWRSHPEMLDRTFAATLSEEKVIEKDFTADIKTQKESVQKSLYGFLVYYVSLELKEKLRGGRKSQLNITSFSTEEDRKVQHLIFLHLAELILGIDEQSDYAKKTLYIVAEQLVVLDTFNRTLAPWGKYQKLQKEIDPNSKYAELYNTRSKELYDELTASFNNNRAGIPTCFALLENFPEHDKKFEIKLGLMRALFQNKNYLDIPERFIVAASEAKTTEQKKALLDFGMIYIKTCEKPYQLSKMVSAFEDETFANAAKKAYPEILEKCQSLREIARFFDDPSSNDLTIDKVKAKEAIVLKTFNRAKLMEKQMKKSEAVLLYEEVITFGENSPYVELAKAALSTLDFQ